MMNILKRIMAMVMILFLSTAAAEEIRQEGQDMAIYKEDIVSIDLENGTIHRSFLRHSIGGGDKLANRFGVRVFRNGQPEALSGYCKGYFIRSSGETIVISDGTISSNVAYVTLPETCYAVEGVFSLAIKVINGSETVTMRIVDGVVSRTSSGSAVDPGTIIPSVEAMLAEIEAAEATIPLDYSNVNKALRLQQTGIQTQTLSWEQGGIDGDTGAFNTSTIQIRTGFIYVGKGNVIKITTNNGYRGHIRWYNGANTSQFVSGENSVSGYITAQADYVALVCTEPNWGTIVPSEGSNLGMKIVSGAEAEIGIVKQAFILASVPIELDTHTWMLSFPANNYCRVITSFGEKIALNILGNVQLQQSCVIYYKKDTNEIVTRDYVTAIDDPNLYLIGITNGSQVVYMNILSAFKVNGVTGAGCCPEFSFLYNYRYAPAYIAVLGDSISTYDGYSEGAYYPSGDVDTVDETWWAIVAKGLRLGYDSATVSAISRTTFIDQNDESIPPAYDSTRIARLGSVHYPSYIFVNMGTNDPYLNNIGNMTYESDITALEALPESTTKGIALTIRKLQEAYSDARIVMLIPKPVAISTVHEQASQYTAELVEKVAERIKELGELYGVYKVIDLRKCDINQTNVASYCEDSAIHPNALGMKRMGEYILHEMLR